MISNELEEKKIISDLPVNCKLCGVTIRQSRNLRRHIDQMHLRSKSKQENGIKRRRKPVPMTGDGPTSCSIEGQRTEDIESSLTDEFSEDSFSQLTDEILNYSGGSESDEKSFSNTVITSTTSDYSLENAISNSQAAASPSVCSISSLSMVKTQETLSSMLEEDLCFQLPTKNDSNSTLTSTVAGDKLGTIPSVERYDCSNLDDSVHVNDMNLKELENQLFSACFCSNENI